MGLLGEGAKTKQKAECTSMGVFVVASAANDDDGARRKNESNIGGWVGSCGRVHLVAGFVARRRLWGPRRSRPVEQFGSRQGGGISPSGGLGQ